MNESESPQPVTDAKTSRRDFIKTASILSLSTIGLTNCDKPPVSKVPDHEESSRAPISINSIMSYRELGNTGLKASDISFGGSGAEDPKVILKAMSHGINFFDTAPDYGAGQSETTLGKALKIAKSRDKFIISTKMCRTIGYPGHLYLSRKEDYIKAVEDSLKRLRTDYIDFLMIHSLGDRGGAEIERLKDEEMLNAKEQLKKDGKVRFLGVSSHYFSAALDGGLDYAIDSGHFNLLLVAYYFKNLKMSPDLYLPKIKELSERAYNKGIAFVAMKTLKGARGIDPSLLKGKGTFAQAAYKWVLSNPNVSCLITTMKNSENIDEYIKASGQKFSQNDQEILEKAYAANFSQDCHIGCSTCEKSCPQGVSVSNVLRFNMYFKNYDLQKEAMQKYHYLPIDKKAGQCQSCIAPCNASCPYGVAVKDKLIEAHQNLSLIDLA